MTNSDNKTKKASGSDNSVPVIHWFHYYNSSGAKVYANIALVEIFPFLSTLYMSSPRVDLVTIRIAHPTPAKLVIFANCTYLF